VQHAAKQALNLPLIPTSVDCCSQCKLSSIKTACSRVICKLADAVMVQLKPSWYQHVVDVSKRKHATTGLLRCQVADISFLL